jgi:hypothetical protein
MYKRILRIREYFPIELKESYKLPVKIPNLIIELLLNAKLPLIARAVSASDSHFDNGISNCPCVNASCRSLLPDHFLNSAFLNFHPPLDSRSLKLCDASNTTDSGILMSMLQLSVDQVLPVLPSG